MTGNLIFNLFSNMAAFNKHHILATVLIILRRRRRRRQKRADEVRKRRLWVRSTNMDRPHSGALKQLSTQLFLYVFSTAKSFSGKWLLSYNTPYLCTTADSSSSLHAILLFVIYFYQTQNVEQIISNVFEFEMLFERDCIIFSFLFSFFWLTYSFLHEKSFARKEIHVSASGIPEGFT